MKKKETLQEKLARRKYKRPNKFLYKALNKVVIKPFLAPKYNPHYEIIDDINECEGPCFLIYNHQSRIDYVWITQATYPKRINFVVGYNEFFRGHLQFIFKLIHNIPKKNFNSDVACIRGMNQIIKQKGVVCFSPEGMSSITGHNQPVATGTGKLLKHYNIPVYCLKTRGGFLTNHKVCLDERKGRVDATLYKLFTPEDLEKLTPEEIELKCDEALWQDDYEWNKKERIKFNTKGRPCEHLHDLCYRCPRCGEELTMIGKDNYIKCNKCGNGATMNDYYDFIPFDETCVIPVSPSKRVDDERKVVYKQIQDPNYSLKFKAKIGKLPEYKYLKNKATSELCGEGYVTIDHQGLHYNGTKDGEEFNFTIEYKLLPTLGMVTDVTFFALYYKGKYYDIFPEQPIVGKVLLTVEEMHRLHVNAWKNFPWADTYNEE